jgi:predicted TIM-barrel fold metal-dependent hydrolase
MPLVDVHEHIGLGNVEFDFMEVPHRSDFSSWIERTLAVGARKDRGRVLLPPLYYEMPRGIENVRHLNDLLAAAASRTDLGIVATLGVVEPQHGQAAIDEISRIAETPLKGIVFSARAQGVFADIPEIVALVRHAGQNGLSVMIHATPGSANERLWRVWNLAEQCPDVPMAALGAFATWDSTQEVLVNAAKAPHLLYDTAGLEVEPIARVVEKLGAHRVMYGSGAHDINAAARLRAFASEPFRELPSAAREMVLHRNAAGFLRLAQ